MTSRFTTLAGIISPWGHSMRCSFCRFLFLIIFAFHAASFMAPPVFAHDETPLRQELQAIADKAQTRLNLTAEETAWIKDNPTIRVGVDADFAPYTFRNRYDFYQEAALDYLNVVGHILGIEFEIVDDLSWSDILSKARSREIDMIATAAKRNEREKYLLFSQFEIPTPIAIMTRLQNASTFQSRDALAGKKVAIVKDYAVGKRVLHNYPDIEPHVVDTPLEALQALDAGEVDAYVGVIGVSSYLIENEGLSNLEVAAWYDQSSGGQHFAIREDWQILKTILDKTLDLLTTRDREAVMHHWVVQPDLSHAVNAALALTADEKAYLEERGPVTYCVDPDWLPYEKIDSEGKHIGIAAEYLDMFAQSANIELQLIPTENWSQSEEFARRRQCDILSFLNFSEERAKYLNFTDPFVEAPMVIISKIDVPFIDGLDQLSGKSFAIVKDYLLEDIIRRQYPEIKLTYVENMDEGLTKISTGEIYATIGSLFIVTTQIQKLGITNLKIAGHTEFSNRFRIGIRNDDPMLLDIFQKAVAQRNQTLENDILQKWMTENIDNGFDYNLIWKIAIPLSLVSFFFWYQFNMNKRHNATLREKNAALERLSQTDPLTGIFNRIKFDEILNIEVAKTKQFDHGLTLIFFDVDHFISINDEYGHQMGDLVLREITQLVDNQIRESDTFGRWSGEAFAILCPGKDIEAAYDLAEMIRAVFEDHTFPIPRKVTASFGISTFHTSDTAESLIKRASDSVVRAKTAGRNRVFSL